MQNPPVNAVKGRILVAFADEAAAKKRAEIFARYKAKEIERIGSTPLYLIEVGPEISVKEVIAKISKEPGVRYAEPDIIVKTMK